MNLVSAQLFRPFWLYLLLAGLLSTSFFVKADNEWLKIKVNGVPEAVEKNIYAHLGPLPKSSIQRRSFLFNADDNIKKAMQSLGYYHATTQALTVSHDQGPWELTLSITLNQPTKISWIDIQVSGELRDDPALNHWLNTLSVKPGDTLNHGVYEDMKAALAALALRKGYFDGQYALSQIEINRDLQLAKIALHYQSGTRYKMGKVLFSGHSLDPSLLNKLVFFNSDSDYSAHKVHRLNNLLSSTGYFSNIKVLPAIDKAVNHHVPINVELTSKPDHSIELGIGVDIGNTTDNSVEPRVKVTWHTPQINRYGHSQETVAEWSPDRPKFLTTYTIPLTHPINDQLKVKTGILRDKYGITQDFNIDDKAFDNTGQLDATKFFVAVIRQQKVSNKWLLTYSIEAMQESYTQSDLEYDPRFFIISSSISKTIRGDNSLDPHSGFFQFYRLDYADPHLGSALRLARFQAKFKWINTFFERHRLVSRLNLGANITDPNRLAEIPPSLRYFAGGDQSIRGYSYNELGPFLEYTNQSGGLSREVIGGRYLAVSSIEYQYYLTPTWRLATFLDAGNAFDSEQFEVISSVGAGVHWISPVGPVKIDVGVGLRDSETLSRPWRIHFTMGAEI